MTEYRLSPVDHATIDDTLDRLREARRALGYEDGVALAEEPARVPSPDDVLYAGEELSRGWYALSNVQSAHSDEDEEREKAAAIRASESAELDQWDAEYRDRGM